MTAGAVVYDDIPESRLPAVELLSKHGFILINYQQRALPKYGYPIVTPVSRASLLSLLVHEEYSDYLQAWEYATSDDNLQFASDLLAEYRFQYVLPNALFVDTYGDFEGKVDITAVFKRPLRA